MLDRRRMAEVRRLAGVTQTQMEADLGLPTGIVSRVERGVVSPSYEDVVRVAEYLGVTPGQLVGKDDLAVRHTH